jgi:Lrp/AsnC family leucine-responsive transcriptional regulator
MSFHRRFLVAIDQTDRRLLALLQREGRITGAEMAERIGLGATATAERLRRLTREGYIQGYSARLDPALLGRGLLVFIEVRLERTTPEVFDMFAAAVRKAPEVMECHMVAGGFDYLLKTRVESMQAYRRFLGDVLLSLPGVRETHTFAVMEEIKSTQEIPL